MPSLWWKNLTRKEQLAYLKDHPRSKLKPKPAKRRKPKDANKKTSAQKSRQAVKDVKDIQEVTVPKPEPLRGNDKKQAEDYVTKNAHEITKALDTRLQDEAKRIPEVIAAMPPKELSAVGRILRDTSEKDRGRRFINAAAIMLGRAGLLTVGLAVSSAIGISPTVYLLGLWNYRDTIKQKIDQPLRDMVEGFTQGVYDSIREGIRDVEGVKKNLVANPPTTSIAPKMREAASIATPHHINDAIVSYNGLCKKFASYDLGNGTRRIQINWMRAKALIEVLKEVEKDIRSLNNLYIRFRLTNDPFYIAKAAGSMEQFMFTRQKIKKELAIIALSSKDEPNQFVLALHKYMHAYGHNTMEKTIIADGDELVLCWCFSVSSFRTKFNPTAQNAMVYVSVNDPCRIAISLERNFTPIAMFQCNSRNPKAVLADYGV